MSATKNNVPENQSGRDPDMINAAAALKRAGQKARQRARQAGIGNRTWRSIL
jgi:lambda repressor-like predicted transcriptional regulator